MIRCAVRNSCHRGPPRAAHLNACAGRTTSKSTIARITSNARSEQDVPFRIRLCTCVRSPLRRDTKIYPPVTLPPQENLADVRGHFGARAPVMLTPRAPFRPGNTLRASRVAAPAADLEREMAVIRLVAPAQSRYARNPPNVSWTRCSVRGLRPASPSRTSARAMDCTDQW